MKRRSFFRKSTVAIAGVGLSSSAYAKIAEGKSIRASMSMVQQEVFFHAEEIREPLKIVHIADTHLFLDDERGIPYRQYSKRMASAYNKTTHFLTGAPTNPEEAFAETLAHAREADADLIVLVGDIFSFPSEAAIEWVMMKLEETGIPYIYTAGNHDWHYEGMEGSLEELRDTWIEKRLKPLYQGRNPLMSTYDIKGIRIVAIDNSTYEVSEEQLAFFNKEVASGEPLVLLVHIPMYAPGKGIYYGCGNPSWGAASDRNYKLEGRPKWPSAGHTKATIKFYRSVFSAPNLLGIFTGHIHRKSIEIIKGRPQIVADDNASGGYLDINFLPLSKEDSRLINS